MTIEINDRLYNEFTSWALANNMTDDDIRKYIEKAFRDRFTLDKYGDLNEKVQQIKTEKKTRKTTKKKSDELNEEVKASEPINEPKSEYINEYINGDINEGVNEGVNEDVKPRRKTKVIKSK